ncbi:MAG TPA: hypothetical protein VGM86_02100, partial [Thermoanaerobaculia bacterium]
MSEEPRQAELAGLFVEVGLKGSFLQNDPAKFRREAKSSSGSGQALKILAVTRPDPRRVVDGRCHYP